ncbi:MAG TPA: Asp-tRNA(Asn)/Glu-tRNA(Gln) amidotransferase subunit GatB [Thermoanaerobaculia bacterium]|nr:Asp-tRNA(Asn)/Glu-tRNA(Gln) amidotransferase subunit GatB [Thermoanaerobaculia bacterium]
MPETAFEPVIGLEVHAQLRTKSKAFCPCPVTFGAPPNTAVCPVCLGYPGTLPVANREMVALAMRVALAVGSTIRGASVFERKNYFYPDLPKGYQISQYELPLATGGRVAVGAAAGRREIRLNRIHLEEDAGKSMHEVPWDDVPSSATLVDLNRAGTPLIEIVTEPDIASPDEAHEYLVGLRRLVRWVDASDGNMEEGSLRCDANVSLRPRGAAALGVKVEIKNLNSIAHVKKALEHEIQRQTAALSSGAGVVQETRLFDPASGATKTMRSKEEAMDYRYFPDPDLGTLVVDAAWIAAVRASMPELPEARVERLAAAYALPAADAALLCSSRPLADWFEAAAAAHPSNPKAVANWLLSDLLGRMSDADKQAGRVPVAPKSLAGLVALIDAGTISGKTAKEILTKMIETGRSAPDLVSSMDLFQISDEDELRGFVRDVLAASASQVAAYRGGKAATFGWFVGQVMKATGGKAAPAAVNRLLKEELER